MPVRSSAESSRPSPLTSRPTTPTPCRSSPDGTCHHQRCDAHHLEFCAEKEKPGGRRSARLDEPVSTSSKAEHVAGDGRLARRSPETDGSSAAASRGQQRSGKSHVRCTPRAGLAGNLSRRDLAGALAGASPAHGQQIASPGWRYAYAKWARSESRVSRRETLLVGVLALLCADAVRPDPGFLIGSRSRHLRPAMEEARDPEGFARLRASLPAELSSGDGSSGLKTTTEIMACQGGAIEDIVVGDLLLWHRTNRTNSNRRIELAYTWLLNLGILPADAPHTLFRISHRTGQLTAATRGLARRDRRLAEQPGPRRGEARPTRRADLPAAAVR